jgi:hypothetical protein
MTVERRFGGDQVSRPQPLGISLYLPTQPEA